MQIARKISQVVGLVVAAIGVVVMLGWVLKIRLLTTVLHGSPAMMFNTAFGFIFSGVSLWLLRFQNVPGGMRQVARVLAAVVALLGLLTWSEYLFSRNFGIDHLLFSRATDDPDFPGRMGPLSAFIFFIVGVSLFFLDDPGWLGRRVAPFFVFLTVTLALLALLAWLRWHFGLAYTDSISSHETMALHTCLAFILLGLGVFFARTDGLLLQLLGSNDSGGVLARRLLPLVCVLPLCVAWLVGQGWLLGFYSNETRACLVIVCYNVLLFLIVRVCAVRLHEMDMWRAHADEKRETLVLELQTALGEIKQLSGFLPICAHCKKIRDDRGYWKQIETYIQEHSEAKFSHGLCEDCIREHHPNLADELLEGTQDDRPKDG